MTKLNRTLLRLTAAAAIAASSVPAHAALLDHGPGDPTLTWPIWYRDLNGLPLQLCRSTTPSPNPAAGLFPMCFPLAADPAGFPGNLGMEIFYNDAVVTLGTPGRPVGQTAFFLKYLASLEASYLTTVPTRGQETVFTRIRMIISATVPGTYKVTHPFGVEIFPDVQPGPRAVFFTNDIAPIVGNFDAALGGTVGPFLQWDQLLPGESLTVTNAAGQQEQFIGDANYAHTFTGSPFGTNYVRIDGPPGSNLDGAGNDFIQTPLLSVLGQKYLLPIPSPLRVSRATYSRDPVKGVNSIDVFANSSPGARVLLTGTDMPSVVMKGDAVGNFFAHLETSAAAPLPASISVTNVTDNPPTTATAALVDLVNITSATYDSLTGAIKVAATSSDLAVPGPALTVEGPLGGPMTAGAFTGAVPATAVPPAKLTVISAAGGKDTDDVVVLPGGPMNPVTAPVAVADVITTTSNVAATVNLAANDSVVAPATVASVVITQVPANGALTLGATPGTVTYTPAANFSGADNFAYVLQDSAGAVSNLATVAVTVTFAPAAPVAKGDNWAMLKGTSRTVSLIANDTAGTGTAINPASIVITTPPAHGSVTPNADGTVTYTPLAAYSGNDQFTYTVANTAGQASNGAVVQIFVSSGPESVSPKRADYVVSRNQWTIVGNTTWFGGFLTPTATCWIGRTAGAGTVLGTAPVDTTGAFTIVPLAGTVPPPDATKAVACRTSNGGVGVFAVTLK
jgi:hypothetical protein